MWYVIGIVVVLAVASGVKKQMKADEVRRKAAFERFVNRFPGWGE